MRRRPIDPLDELLLLAARTLPSATQIDRIQALAESVDLDAFAERAAALNLVSLSYETLHRVLDEKTRPRLERLRSRHKQNALRNQILARALRELLRKLEEEQISALTVKGVVLARLVYNSTTAREIGDLDLLVHPRDVARAASTIESLGYVRVQPLPEASRDFVVRRDVRFEKAPPPTAIVIELHWKFKDTFFRLPEPEIWRKLTFYELDGQTLPSISRELTLIHLLHQLNYEAYPLRNLVDLAEAFSAFDELVDWVIVEDLATRFGLLRNLHTALDLMVRVLERELPSPVLEIRERLKGYSRRWLSALLTHERFHFDATALALKTHPRARAAFSAFFLDEGLARSIGTLARRSLRRR